MKVIQNVNLLKKLQPILEDVDTEYVMMEICEPISSDLSGITVKKTGKFKVGKPFMQRVDINCGKEYKTLTLEEAIDLLPETFMFQGVRLWWYFFPEYISQFTRQYKIRIDGFGGHNQYDLITGLTPIHTYESFLDYLITNNLLGTEK